MPVSAGEQRGFVVFGVGLLLVMTLVAWLNANENEKGEGTPSSYNVQRRGAKAAYLLLQKSGYAVARWRQPTSQLPADASGMILVLAGPESYPQAGEMGGIVRFLLHGGNVLITGVRPESFVPQSSAESGDLRVGFSECTPVAPTSLTRGGAISQDGDLFWNFVHYSATHFVIHFKDKNDKPVVVSYQMGQGRVIWWASALPLTNAGIRDRGNLDLLLNSIGDNRTVLWDEYYHGEHATSRVRSSDAVQTWALAQAGFLGLLVIVTFSRRSGPVVPLVRDSRLSPLEFVQTLGSVFHRARGAQVAVEIAFGRFQQIAARRLGIRGTGSAEEILVAMEQRGLKIPEDTAALVRHGEEASGDTELTEGQALRHVQALSHAAQLLESPASPAEPKMQKRTR
jgi:hypothetical protein